MARQMVSFSCENCHVMYRVYHSLDEPFICESCDEVLYWPTGYKTKSFEKKEKPRRNETKGKRVF